MIINRPLTPEQIKAQSQPSAEDVRRAQDALFIYLLQRVEELESKVDPPKKTRKSVT